MLFTYFPNDFEIVPVAPVITGIIIMLFSVTGGLTRTQVTLYSGIDCAGFPYRNLYSVGCVFSCAPVEYLLIIFQITSFDLFSSKSWYFLLSFIFNENRVNIYGISAA